MKVVISSKNPVKIQATKNAFEKMFPDSQTVFYGESFPSHVAEQPMSDEETLTGAVNRAQGAKQNIIDADYWVGIEGGVEENNSVMEVFAWIVILSQDVTSRSSTSTFALPERVAVLLRQGMELGDADDVVFGRSNSKQQNGAVGLLTNDLITRTAYYELSLVLALIPFKKAEYYSLEQSPLPADPEE